MDDHIAQDGWWSMTGLQRAVQPVPYFIRKILVSLNTAATAPALTRAGNSKRRQLSDSEATRHTVAEVMGDWPAGPR